MFPLAWQHWWLPPPRGPTPRPRSTRRPRARLRLADSTGLRSAAETAWPALYSPQPNARRSGPLRGIVIKKAGECQRRRDGARLTAPLHAEQESAGSDSSAPDAISVAAGPPIGRRETPVDHDVRPGIARVATPALGPGAQRRWI